MIKLYEFGNSVCCQKVRITMAAKSLAWEAIEVDLFRNQQYDPAYLKINPAGVVPSLVDDGEVVTESTLICEYLDQKYPDPPLMPSSPVARADARRWAKMADEGLHEGVSAISFSAMFRERMKAMTAGQRQGRFDNVGDPRRRDLMKLTFESGARSPFVEYAVAAYERAFARLEATLAAGGPWIMGAAPTLADIALMPYVARLAYLNLLDLWTHRRPQVRSWWDAVQAWSSFQAGVTAPMKAEELNEMARFGPTIRADLAAILAAARSSPAPAAR